MKKVFLFLSIILNGINGMSQNSIEVIKINNLNIIKPTIQNLMNITKMEFSSFDKAINNIGYQKIGVEGDMTKYSTGTIGNSSGNLEISKSQFRMMISILWLSGDGQKMIFDDLTKQLEPFFQKLDEDNNLLFQMDTTTGESYQIVLRRKTGSETILFIRTK